MARGGSYHFSCFVFYDFGISQSIKALDQDSIFLVVWGCSVVIVIHNVKEYFGKFQT
jgi:hypothetical protein